VASSSPVAKYVRHTGDNIASHTELHKYLLWKSAGVAIHYDNIPSLNNNDYKGNKVAYLNEVAQAGGNLIGYFKGTLRKGARVLGRANGIQGILVYDESNREVLELVEAKPGEVKDELAEKYGTGYEQNGIHFFKYAGAEEWHITDQTEHKEFVEWGSISAIHGFDKQVEQKRAHIETVLSDETGTPNVSTLSSNGDEFLASRYLRDKVYSSEGDNEDFKSPEFYLRRKPGGNTQGVDILGGVVNGSDHKRVDATVTSATGDYNDQRVTDINNAPQHADKYFFGVSEPDGLNDDVTFIALKDVVEWFAKSDETKHQEQLATHSTTASIRPLDSEVGRDFT
jgi:hypothetical protein